MVATALLSSSGQSWARWADTSAGSTQPLASGTVRLSPDADPVIQLVSQQPIGSRTYTSTSSCPVPTGAQECRVVTTSLATEALIPGDTVRIAQSVTLAATGDNLRGEVEVDLTGLVNSATSALSGAAQVSGTVQPPQGGAVQFTGGTAVLPVDVSSARNLGIFSLQAEVRIPVSDDGAAWGTALRGQTLDFGAVTWTFTQNP